MHPTVHCFILINVFWDIISAAAIVLKYEAIASWHTDLWVNDDDRTNPAARTLMAWLIFTFGLARLAAVIDPSVYLTCGLVSYIIEGLLFLVSTCMGTIKRQEGFIVAFGSFGLAGLMLL